MNIVILTGDVTHKDYKKIIEVAEDLGHNLLGFVLLNDENDFGKVDDYDVYPASFLPVLKYDFALIDSDEQTAEKFIIPALINIVPREKIKTVYWLLQQVMTKKYESSKDEVIQDTLDYWKTHELSIFNQHTASYEDTFDEMRVDEACGLPYIMFKTVEGKEKRMYYPPGSGWKAPDGKTYIANVLREQVPTSPHLYTKAGHQVNDGDVLIDAGVCEGNFALRYVDICSKIYLFEMDKRWFAPLYYTFKDYWDKVEFIPKAVSDISGGGGISLDDVIAVPAGKNIFLKMDIEGAEVAALHGAKRILSSNKARASICSYHRRDDCWRIKSIFEKYGYKTSTSEGYMVFIYNDEIWESADFRKGIVYASNY